MKRLLSLTFALATMAAISAVAFQQPRPSFTFLDWAKEAAHEKPTVALLLEFGLNDANVRDWSGAAQVSGAKVVNREGYRFRSEDKLVGADAWEAHSHRAIRLPKGQPAVSKMEPIATVGIVLHLQDVQPDAKIAIKVKDDEKAEVPLKDVLSGKTHELWNGAAAVRLVSTAQPVAVGPTEDDMPAAAYAPDGTLWVAYVSYHVKEEERRIEAPPLKEQPKSFEKYFTPDGGDQVMLRGYKNGKWSEPIKLTDDKQSIARVAIGVTGHGGFWVVYSALRNGNHRLYGRPCDARGRFGDEVEITKGARDLSPTMCTDASGNVRLEYQEWNHGGSAFIHLKDFQGGVGGWRPLGVLGQGKTEGNCWHPVTAAGPDGRVAIAYDQYVQGNYDVILMTQETIPGGTRSGVHTIATSPKFEARPSVVYDQTGRLWIAYEEGPEQWGKDYGTLAMNKGKPLFNERSVRVVCLERDGKLTRPAAELPTSHYDPPQAGDAVNTNNYERTTRYAYPKIGIDGQGNVWITYRQNIGSRYSSHPGSMGRTFARRLEGDHWSEPIEVHHSDGLLDHRPVLLPHVDGGLVIIHNTDGRYTTPETIDNQIYMSTINLPGTPAAPKLVPHNPGENPPNERVKSENEAISRMRAGLNSLPGSKNYFFKRGEFHRHTEISWDGGADGSLEDMFRYAIDAAGFDWIGNGDHDNGAGREYSWWLVQKFTDAYSVPKRFTGMFSYERSVSYPHGHRNVMFAFRGMRTLPRLAPPLDPPLEKGEKQDDPSLEKGGKQDDPPLKKGGKGGVKAEGGVHPDDTKMLYRYLRERGGICASHTSATGMGTDWRDNDPVAEPIVEIYQGDRMSYEYEGAPRAGYDPKSKKEPANVAGWYPKGFVNHALQKGYRLGFQASSDHWSTHISYFIALVELRNAGTIDDERQALLDAIKKRHCYGATDNIFLTFVCDHQAIMGDEITVNAAPNFSVRAFGTAPLAKIEILRDSEVVASLLPKDHKGAEFQYTGTEHPWTEPQPQPGTHYYYVRVLQTDGEIAWSSPIWVTKK